MSRHPGTSPDHEAHVRTRAHAIWEKEGRPHRKEKEHWEKALRELGAEKEHDSSTVQRNKKQSAGAGVSSAKRKPPSRR